MVLEGLVATFWRGVGNFRSSKKNEGGAQSIVKISNDLRSESVELAKDSNSILQDIETLEQLMGQVATLSQEIAGYKKELNKVVANVAEGRQRQRKAAPIERKIKRALVSLDKAFDGIYPRVEYIQEVLARVLKETEEIITNQKLSTEWIVPFEKFVREDLGPKRAEIKKYLNGETKEVPDLGIQEEQAN